MIISIVGFLGGFVLVYKYLLSTNVKKNIPIISKIISPKEVIGFLPYWLTGKAKSDYSDYITKLTYFSLSINKDGTIQKFTSPNESEPGYLALVRGKIDSFLDEAKNKSVDLSLSVFMINDDNINELLNDPVINANNLTSEVIPIMQKYKFNDLNLDVEQVQDASPEARINFTKFVKTVNENIKKEKNVTFSIDVSASAFVKNTNLSNPKTLAPYVDKMIIMAYDYHYSGSYVTGPVAPGEGASMVSEFDTKTAVESAVNIMSSHKVILGIPLYGYEWESIGDVPRSAVIPRSGLIISSQKAESLLEECATCSAVFDETDKENHIIYKDGKSNTYHQVFYPDIKSTKYKVNLAEKYDLGGIALWALGYEDKTILEPLSLYRN